MIILVHSSINSVLDVTHFYSGFLTTFLKWKKRNIICYIRNALKCFINQTDILQSNSSLRFFSLMYQKIFICINYCYSFVNRSSDKNWNKKTIKKYKNCLIATIETNSEQITTIFRYLVMSV